MKSNTLPRDWRDRLPSAANYYNDHVEHLSPANSTGWALGRCPFHANLASTLNVQMVGTRGLFKCPVCGARGDLVTFHIRKTGLPFAEAARDLMAWRNTAPPKGTGHA